MIIKSHYILYVKNQKISAEFYSKLLNQKPIIDEPGMTEFKLNETSILGLMPESGIRKLLENKVETNHSSENKIKAELYLIVDDLETYLKRVLSLNAKFLSEAKIRDWGDRAAYLMDPNNYIIALAEKN